MHQWTPLAVALWAALVGCLAVLLPGGAQWDGFQLYAAAQALLHGADPYQAVTASGFPWPLYYPLPAVLLMVPFAGMSEPVARIAWAACTGAVFGYALRGKPALAGALSASFLACLLLGQLAPALTAAALVPGLGFLWAAKPSLGLALFAAYPSRKAVVGSVTLVLLSLVVMPDWPLRWLEALGTMPQKAPLLLPGGFLLLLAFVRWRKPEGRLLGTLSLVPHAAYDAVCLFLIPKTLRQGLLLAGSTLLGAAVSHALWPWVPGGDVAHPGRWVVSLVTLYLPALWLLLRHGGDGG